MRTVDPELWSRKVKRPKIQVTRRMKFGQQVSCSLETRLRESLRDATAEYWHNCSLSAAKYYKADQMNNKYERWRHITLLIVTLVLGWVILLLNHAHQQARPPIIVSLQSDDNSVIDFNFPAVALCSNQVISRAALKNYSRYLYNHPKNKLYNYRENQIEHNLLDLGALLTLALPPGKVNFDKFIREVEPDFNVTDIMFRFSANCSAILRRCSWRGEITNCESLFASRLTALGFCCVFNSRYQYVDKDQKPAVLDLMGQDYGLGVVVQEVRDDFAYVRRPVYGMELLLFEGYEYPVMESGNVRMYPMPRNSSIYLNIRASTQYPSSSIRHFTEERRGCRLGGGGMSWCLAKCRRQTAAALCGCVPYALQPQFVPLTEHTCMLSDLACLNKHREKFMYLFPGEGADRALSQEVQDGMDCSYCLVQCKRLQYFAQISHSAYASKSRIFRNYLAGNLSMVNATTIRLFYSNQHQKWYKVEPLTRWFESFVKLGTQWMVVTGMSILGYSEIVYFGTFRWLHHFMRRTRLANMTPVATSSVVNTD